jgi:hypothetical protein
MNPKICGIVLVSPYLFDRKDIFYQKENKYHIFKYRVEFIIRAHHIKNNVSFVSTGKMKSLVREIKYFVLMMVKHKEEYITNVLSGCDPYHKHEFIKIVPNYDELFQYLTGSRGISLILWTQQEVH